MRLLVLVIALAAGLPAAGGTTALQQNYLGVYLEIKEAQQHELEKDYLGALLRNEVARSFLAKMYARFPDWEPALVQHRLNGCTDKITALTPLAQKQLADSENEWPLDPEAKEQQGGWAALDRAQAKVTFLELMKANHPELAQGGFGEDLQQARKKVDDLENAALGQAAAAQGANGVQ